MGIFPKSLRECSVALRRVVGLPHISSVEWVESGERRLGVALCELRYGVLTNVRPFCTRTICGQQRYSYISRNEKDNEWNWNFVEFICTSFLIGDWTCINQKNGVFWDVTRCGSCKNRRFGGTWPLLHQGDKIGELGTTLKNAVFWDVTPCGYCKNRRFGGT
jgi:hypothetical protein